MTLHILPLLDSNSLSHHARAARSDLGLEGFALSKQYTFVRKIGAGTYGLIYLVRDNTTGAEYAAKMTMTEPVHSLGSRDGANENKKFIQRKMYEYFAAHTPADLQELDLELISRDGQLCPFLREIALHLKVHRHPNVVTIHKVFSLQRFAVVTLMDYFPQGDLFGNIIDNHIFLTREKGKQLMMKNCMLQLIEAIAYCAANGVYHCDLKPENVMVQYNPLYVRSPENHDIIDHNEIFVSLIDFGLAMTSNLICCNACRGSSFYMAPERIVNYNTNRLVRSLLDMGQFQDNENSTLDLSGKLFPTLPGDIWSLGVLFINITCARNPWPIANINDRHEVFANYILHNKSILQTILPILRQFNLLLNDIFCLNPNDRMSLEEMRHRVAKCDFYHDGPSYNEQLCTPPTELNLLPATPNDSVDMEQCKQQVKVFNCTKHHGLVY